MILELCFISIYYYTEVYKLININMSRYKILEFYSWNYLPLCRSIN